MDKRLNILLIEDDTSLGSITSEYLVARGFNCLWEQNGELAHKDLSELIERLKNVESEHASSELSRLGTKSNIKD